MAIIPIQVDQFLAALDQLHERAANAEAPRAHLDASQIGRPCSRAIWYAFRWAVRRPLSVTAYRAIQDSHRGKQVMADWLRSIEGVQLWTEDDESGQPIGFQSLGGHFAGSLDGVIQGLPQAPKTPHVWSHKQVSEKKFNKLVRLVVEHGEKAALAEWNEVYYAQAQVHMRMIVATRHFLTVCTPGNRAIASCRTEHDKERSAALMTKATKIIAAERPPLKLSDRPDHFVCQQCDFRALCQGISEPGVHCRTCAHSTARTQDGTPWQCELRNLALSEDAQREGCESHAFHPDLLANWAKPHQADPTTGALTFRRLDGATFANGREGCPSKELFARYALPAHDVLGELSVASGIDEAKLLAGEITESDWGRIASAFVMLKDRLDESSTNRLVELVGQIDKAYCERSQQAEVAAA